MISATQVISCLTPQTVLYFFAEIANLYICQMRVNLHLCVETAAVSIQNVIIRRRKMMNIAAITGVAIHNMLEIGV